MNSFLVKMMLLLQHKNTPTYYCTSKHYKYQIKKKHMIYKLPIYFLLKISFSKHFQSSLLFINKLKRIEINTYTIYTFN